MARGIITSRTSNARTPISTLNMTIFHGGDSKFRQRRAGQSKHDGQQWNPIEECVGGSAPIGKWSKWPMICGPVDVQERP